MIGDIPCSLWIDRFAKGVVTKLISYLLLGLVVGIVTILIFIAFLSGQFIGAGNLFIFGVYGSVGAVIYYFFLSLLNFLNRIAELKNGYR